MTGLVFVMFYYLFIICGNLSKQFFSIVQLFRGEYKQYHSGLFLVGTVHIIFICEAFGNSRIFPTSNKPGKKQVPNAGTESDREHPRPNARDEKFSRFFGKNPVPEKWHSGTQPSNKKGWGALF